MFIGHFAVGMAAKKVAPEVSLGTLFIGAQLVDLLWPFFLMAGWETVRMAPGITVVTPFDFESYPFTHSLLTTLGWGVLAFLAGKYVLKSGTRAAMVLGLAVVSHWVLDLIVHRPDLPLYPGQSPLLGLGLWNSLPGTLVVEGLIFVAGVALYIHATAARDKIGIYGFWGLAGLLVLIYLGNVFSPPPANLDQNAIAWMGHLQWIFILLAYWVDRHRTAVASG